MAKKKNAAQKQNGGESTSTSFTSTGPNTDSNAPSGSNLPIDALLSTQTADETAQIISKTSATLKSRRVDILAASAAMVERDAIKVNNLNVTELKNACDDVLKKLLSQPGLFQENHMHTDVKLLLGWASVIVAGATSLYGWKVEFEQSKPLVWTGVILYVILTTASTLYSFFVEKDTVFVGRRKTLAKRIETENISVSTHAVPAKGGKSPEANVPRYHTTVSYVRSANGGKSLLGKGKLVDERPFNEFFDAEGTMDQEVFERWVGDLAERVIDGR